jgi:hypothetical protein
LEGVDHYSDDDASDEDEAISERLPKVFSLLGSELLRVFLSILVAQFNPPNIHQDSNDYEINKLGHLC